MKLSHQAIAVLLAILVCYAYFPPRWADWNQNSRLDLVVALVDDQTYAIDRYVANTGDYAYYQGHYYSDKAPGMAILGFPVYAAFRAIVPSALLDRAATGVNTALQATLNPTGAGVQTNSVRFYTALVATAFVVGVVPAVVLAAVFFWMVGRLGGSRREQIVSTSLYALGTSAFPYANSLVGHQTVAFLTFATFALLFAVRQAMLSRGWLFLAGFLLGYAVITEFQAALIAVVLGLYALATLRPIVNVCIRLIVGAVPPMCALVIHDLGAFGTPLPIGYLHSTLWTDVHQTGFVSLTYPHLDALLGITVGTHRGLFFLSPYLVLAVVGLAILRHRGWRAETLVLGAVPLVYAAFNASSAMWQGGFSVGPRYLVASLPFLALPSGAGFIWLWRRLWLRPLLLALAAWSLFAVWAETIGGQAFPDYTQNPLFDFSIPKLLAGDIARNLGMLFGLKGWASLLPLVSVLVVVCAPRPLRRAGVNARAIGRRATWVSHL
jgi:hypothetical protein